MHERTIRFLLDGRPAEVREPPPTMTLLQYLREHAGRCGTKEGCAEGDCGACTVVLADPGEPTAASARAINACIRLLPTVDGLAVTTVEGLSAPGAALHPVQQAMVDCHASQCGFCTPGFVMSLYALYLRQPSPDREAVLSALSGNLCRCTGYRPIIEAGMRMGAYPQPAPPPAAEAAALPARAQPLDLPGFYAPRTLEQLATRLLLQPDALLLAGGTDIGLWVTKQLRELPPLIYLGEVAALRRIDDDGEALTIGAGVTLAAAWAALCARYPAFAELAERFASPPVRNAGTLCGNLANGSPIGDSMPVLLALDAQLLLRRGGASRVLPLHRFYLGYQKKDLLPGEFIEAVRVPHHGSGWRFAGYKLAKRHDQDISAVCLGIATQLDGGRIVAARIGVGGMAATPRRAHATEAALGGQRWSAATFAAARSAFVDEFEPLSDLRASRQYRLRAAANLFERHFLEASGEQAARLRLSAVQA